MIKFLKENEIVILGSLAVLPFVIILLALLVYPIAKNIYHLNDEVVWYPTENIEVLASYPFRDGYNAYGVCNGDTITFATDHNYDGWAYRDKWLVDSIPAVKCSVHKEYYKNSKNYHWEGDGLFW